MKTILVYSAKKIKVKPPAPYSILNPETNSDCPSAKSKGVRLVSGLNIEYGAGGFTLIFLAEYTRIVFIRILLALIFLGGDFYSFIFFIKLAIISFGFIWVRGTLPRFRYDKLMYLA
ncbi:NADH-ubiquinone oxidoreductase chain 1-like [Schistocerca gregaria]|uniref:NADH-ubiquinone oxidoreductase chain 1-like n=1 Tax=Schistocerca gregaria TaxID=7010 RepID=UPI00211EDCA8|nr:NADH-ubiquinone oxidoreductase chain 1-like [Schistocerca gregaria]